jgi:hypothetical protein
MSPPAAIGTPLSSAIRKLARHSGWFVFISSRCFGSRFSPAPSSSTLCRVDSVGTSTASESLKSAIASSSIRVPCSMVSTPARERKLHGIVRLSVHRNPAAVSVCFFHSCREFVLAHCRVMRPHMRVVLHPARHQFDVVNPATHLVADCTDDLVGAVGVVPEPPAGRGGVLVLGARGRADAPSAGEHTRAGKPACGDRIASGDGSEADRSDVSDRRIAGTQQNPCVAHTVDGGRLRSGSIDRVKDRVTGVDQMGMTVD